MIATAQTPKTAKAPPPTRLIEWQIVLLSAFAGGSLLAAMMNLAVLGMVALVRRQVGNGRWPLFQRTGLWA